MILMQPIVPPLPFQGDRRWGEGGNMSTLVFVAGGGGVDEGGNRISAAELAAVVGVGEMR